MDEISRVLLEQIHDIDARDEDQILSEIAGEQIREMFYVTRVKDRDGKLIDKPKLSWAGTKEAARVRGNIVVEDYPQVSDAGNGLRIIVKVTDLSKNFSIFGGCHQPYQMKVNDIDRATGKITGSHLEDDPFCFQKGLSKAQRNAIQTIMPSDFMAKCLNKFLTASGQRQIPQTTAKREPAKPKVNKDIPEPTKLDTLFDLEKYAYDRWHLQPAEMYKELGFGSRNDVSETPFELFLRLKESKEVPQQ